MFLHINSYNNDMIEIDRGREINVFKKAVYPNCHFDLVFAMLRLSSAYVSYTLVL